MGSSLRISLLLEPGGRRPAVWNQTGRRVVLLVPHLPSPNSHAQQPVCESNSTRRSLHIERRGFCVSRSQPKAGNCSGVVTAPKDRIQRRSKQGCELTTALCRPSHVVIWASNRPRPLLSLNTWYGSSFTKSRIGKVVLLEGKEDD